ncbi:DUF2489 domain-containing protein [Marinimicrobium sp. ABcell2]|uniref:DUF2489 domain-containing protein n=1 Tax=Marinimicrobium sp. ABcell2 TaxID=3069751 RepID=UPI0027ADD215|nr:DUF2489 domain-containing protein [Marinimicrobium sp. ABcell2]MDQ2078019.1 DUF2489 domain-containing protein [Marinimicrobium sp. ABcell2]
MTLEVILLVIAVVIILALAVVAVQLQYRLYKLKRDQNERQAVMEREGEAQRERVNRSIQIIAKSVGNDDITLTEASIRISVLLDSLGVEEPVREEFSAFYQLAEANSHIPILEEWRKLSPKQQFALDQQRVTQEVHYQEFILDAAQRIQGRTF